jgi:TetR/AcrR family transcriptional repressor of nem operon
MKTAETERPTKERLLDAAQRLMLAKGFEATTVDEICDAAKLTKGSFFHYFESKEQLAKEVLERFCSCTRQAAQENCSDQRDPLRRVYDYIDWMIRMSREQGIQGCLLGTFAQELSGTHPQIRSCCDKEFSKWSQCIQRDLDEAKAAHAPRAALDTQSLADHFIGIMEGSLILAKAKQDPKVIEKSLRHFRKYLESLFGR